MTLTPTGSKQLIVTLPEDVTPELFAKITNRLAKKHIQVLHIEDLRQAKL